MGQRCYVLWTQDKKNNRRFEPVVFTSAAAAITEGERQVENGLATDYNYSIVECPNMGPDHAPKNFHPTGLTLNSHQPTIQL